MNIWLSCLSVLLRIVFAEKGCPGTLQCYACDDCEYLNDCLLEPCPQITPPPTVVSTTTGVFPSTTMRKSTTPPMTTLTTTARTTPLTTIFRTTTTKMTTVSELKPLSSTEPTTALTEVATSESRTEEFSTTIEDYSSRTAETSGNSQSSTVALGTTELDPTSIGLGTSLESNYLTDNSTTPRLSKTLPPQRSPSPSVSYHCYKIEVVENHKLKNRRGCVEVPEKISACDVLKAKYGCSVSNCRICTESRCNSSSRCDLIIDVLLIAVVAIGILLK